MKFTVERSKWLRGIGSEHSFLLRSTDGKMCCLGFLGLACGLDPERITNIDSPNGIPVSSSETARKEWSKTVPEAEGLFREYVKDNSVVCEQLMETNDMETNDSVDESHREKALTKLFAEIGIEVKFVD